ncbi:hypothetical protein P7K49_035735, partial [Saguinus oedipus]
FEKGKNENERGTKPQHSQQSSWRPAGVTSHNDDPAQHPPGPSSCMPQGCLSLCMALSLHRLSSDSHSSPEQEASRSH